ncbi:zinc finger CW-type PWWP domain protein 2 homolog isoform X3 [Paramormyrops kingsleyae]|uniref:zinc finger CW-type PWWP domain protein 2 homolog isoform X3 n=1 Tax=Paramormyrops kingsleyae TaxID=1676925 RepID=UPI000CD67357|nr:zinc finger CW-type PWWP domain protein 2 isoform X2 [Paramormyrops kingsleyae]
MESQSQSEQQEEVPFYVDRALVKHDSEAGLKRRQQSVRDGCTFDPDQLWSGRTNPEPFCHRSVSQELRGRRCQLPVGTLLMVKAGRWPWWPAVLSPDPESGECVKLGGDGGMQKYHVEFLGSPRTRFWASPKSTELYHAPCANPRAMRGSLKRSYVIAMEEAVQMKDVPCEVRLQMCHFRPTNARSSATACMQSEPQAETIIIGGFVFKSWTHMEDAVGTACHPGRQVRSVAPSAPLTRLVHSQGIPRDPGQTQHSAE